MQDETRKNAVGKELQLFNSEVDQQLEDLKKKAVMDCPPDEVLISKQCFSEAISLFPIKTTGPHTESTGTNSVVHTT